MVMGGKVHGGSQIFQERGLVRSPRKFRHLCASVPRGTGERGRVAFTADRIMKWAMNEISSHV